VLRSALRANADDGMAHFLLGSRYLSGGLVDEAIGEWQRARALRPAIPTLHRNLGLALLVGKGDATESHRVFEEGLTADPRNVEIYEGLDRVLSFLGAPANERVNAVRRYPSQAEMPPSLVFKLALALAEQGDSAAAEALFRNRFFPREEGGTSVRAVFVQVRLSRADAAAREGRCADALQILDSFDHETPGLEFARGGFADLLQPAIVQRQIASIESTCGRQSQARQRLARLARNAGPHSGPLQIALAFDAARALGEADGDVWHRRLIEALDAASRALEAGTTSAPGTLQLASGLLLRALGREAEAARALADVFKLPDRNLSYHLARSALSRARGRR
jgi:tetratricopeptide (TPR) repeat protein